MISHLVIRNFAIIHHLEVPFYEGLSVLTGETGAGKSIVINALNLVLGGRASTDVIRTDQDEAVVEAVFELTGPHLPRALGIDTGAGQLVVRRIVSRSGRNKVFINGSASTVAVLQQVTGGMVDISGQHEHYSLMKNERHLDMLDAFGALEENRGFMRQAFSKVQKLRNELAALRTDDRERFNRIDFLKYQLVEIDNAELTEGEDDALETELKLLKNAEKIGDSARRASLLTYDGDGSAIEKVSEAHGLLAKIADVDPTLTEIAERFELARIALEDVTRDLSAFSSGIIVDAHRLDKVIERLEAIKRLKIRHGADIRAILAEAQAMRDELNTLEHAEERGAELEQALSKAEAEATKIAQELSKERRQAALLLERGIVGELESLNMTGSQFKVSFNEAQVLGSHGIDDIEFLLAANTGEAPKPLTKIASGGELSRIMLAIKSVLADRDSIPIYIFDEVDTGIGGETADLVGQKIAETARDHQVVVITHLAQIASRGDHHYLVEKGTIEDRTESSVRLLNKEERVEEIARMLGGARVTTKTREAASELLGHA